MHRSVEVASDEQVSPPQNATRAAAGAVSAESPEESPTKLAAVTSGRNNGNKVAPAPASTKATAAAPGAASGSPAKPKKKARPRAVLTIVTASDEDAPPVSDSGQHGARPASGPASADGAGAGGGAPSVLSPSSDEMQALKADRPLTEEQLREAKEQQDDAKIKQMHELYRHLSHEEVPRTQPWWYLGHCVPQLR